MSTWSDTHCHLYVEQFDEDRQAVIEEATDLGIKRFFLPNIDSSYTDRLCALVNDFPECCLPMTGLHPCSVNADFEKELNAVHQFYLNQKSLFSGRSKVVAVGEIGIDLYWDKTFLEQQKEAFTIQVNWAKEWGLPIVIHVRDGFDVIFNLMDKLNDSNLSGVFHCFTGNLTQAEKIIEYGDFKLGIGGVSTFKNGGLDKVIPHIDPQYIVLETDSPYLAPTPFRGKRNKSAYIVNVAQRVADLYEMSLESLSKIMERNTDDLFKL